MKPWAIYNRGQRITPRQLANRLGEYKIHPKSVRLGMAVSKGYERDQFDDAFTRYIPSTDSPLLSATTLQHASNVQPERVTDEADREKLPHTQNHDATRKPTLDKACNV